MNVQLIAILAVAALLAFANGANDVSKGVATLVGSGVADYRKAILWGTAFTAAGGLLAVFFAGALLSTFGSGVIASGVKPTLTAALATLAGAAAWVAIATRTGLPVSTTHALVGALTGVAAVAYGSEAVRWSALGGKVLLPLLASPLASFLVTSLALRSTGSRSAGPGAVADCACAELSPAVLAAGAGRVAAVAMASGPSLRVYTGGKEACAEARPALRVTLDHLHWLSSGATSLARGMNDAPKIVALALAAAALAPGARVSAPVLYAAVVAGMALGSLVAGRRVTHVLAEKVATMDHRDGLAANLATAVLVTVGAVQGLPMSTTHVASGGIAGAGARRRALRARTLRDIALAWVVTLPGAALLGTAAYGIARAVQG
ncbi:MAG TPA: inorganic phosphate transporter [Anaeromyxobacter sp.]